MRLILLAFLLVFPALVRPADAAGRKGNRQLRIERQRQLDASDVEAVMVFEIAALRDQVGLANKTLRARVYETMDLVSQRQAAAIELRSTEQKVAHLAEMISELQKKELEHKEAIDELATLNVILIRACEGLQKEIHRLTRGRLEIARGPSGR